MKMQNPAFCFPILGCLRIIEKSTDGVKENENWV